MPVADAGVDHWLVFPTLSTDLNGHGTDVDGKIVKYKWTQQTSLQASQSFWAATIMESKGEIYVTFGSIVWRLQL
jgi:hypothetical protein